jgi:hypothetical protein
MLPAWNKTPVKTAAEVRAYMCPAPIVSLEQDITEAGLKTVLGLPAAWAIGKQDAYRVNAPAPLLLSWGACKRTRGPAGCCESTQPAGSAPHNPPVAHSC